MSGRALPFPEPREASHLGDEILALATWQVPTGSQPLRGVECRFLTLATNAGDLERALTFLPSGIMDLMDLPSGTLQIRPEAVGPEADVGAEADDRAEAGLCRDLTEPEAAPPQGKVGFLPVVYSGRL